MVKRKTVGTRVKKRAKKVFKKIKVVQPPIIDPETGKPVKKPRAPYGSKKNARKQIAAKFVNARHFTDPEAEINKAGAGFHCTIIEKMVNRSHCALGLCGRDGKKCPHYRSPEEQELFLAWWDARETKPEWMSVLFSVKTDKKGKRKLVYQNGY